MAVEPIAEGEAWAYRKAGGPFEEVTVLKVVSQSGNKRVRIQFEDGPNAGQAQWISRRMLKAPWHLREDFLARENRWAEARDCAGFVPEYELDAAAILVDATIDQAIASDKGHGILAVRDLPSLLALVRPVEDPSLVRGFTEGDTTYLPWPAMKIVAKERARSSPAQALREIEAQSASWGEHEQHWRHLDALAPWPRGGVEPISRDEENMKLAWDLAREWCGTEAADQWVELTRLRAETARLAKLLDQSLDALEAAGSTYQANRLRGHAGPAFKKPSSSKRK